MQLSGRGAIDRRISGLSRPHGVVGRDRLLVAGIAAHLIDSRVASGWLRPMYRGVYAVGPLQSADARKHAAVLACGQRAALSHEAAGIMWRLVRYEARGPVDVTVPAPRRPRREGIRAHRVKTLPADEVTRLRQITITTPARTVLDLASRFPIRELEQTVAQAVRTYAGTERRLIALLARYPARPGTPRLRQLLGGTNQPALARSEAEERLLTLVRRAGLPDPEVNVALFGYEVDSCGATPGSPSRWTGSHFMGIASPSRPTAAVTPSSPRVGFR